MEDKKNIVDIEACAKEGRKPEHGFKYKININGLYSQVENEKITGKDILKLYGVSPVEYKLRVKYKDGTRKDLGLDEELSLVTDPCPERFEIVPSMVQQGNFTNQFNSSQRVGRQP